jgi:putative SOS response-associated peptidase YedK
MRCALVRTTARAPIFAPMCGRFTHRYTWADIHRLYRLTSPASNVQPSYNVCPTDTVNVVTSLQDTRILQPMRWGLIPRWWSKPLKDLMGLSTFNARVETVTTKPFFREVFKRTRCIIPASGYYDGRIRQAASSRTTSRAPMAK